MNQTPHSSSPQDGESRPRTIIIERRYNNPDSNSNGVGIAGFVLSLIALFFGWVPVFGWILWLLGLVFSCVGIFKPSKGLAIAGVVISFFGLAILVLLTIGIIGAGLAAMAV